MALARRRMVLRIGIHERPIFCALSRSVVTFVLVGGIGGCASRALERQMFESGQMIGRSELHGVWENPATGHVVQFTPHRTDVFHRLDEFCIRDTGVVPPYSLYR